ncbi:MAG: metallophosphoesterase [Clostridia bacterium]|nr:metallophosphoesterase [Clostridia bacterium]
MVYCMADIHGEYGRFRKMLETIGFSDGDRLYIIGDMIDRGPDSIDLVLDVMGRKNVVFLLGNHEEMCLDDLVRHAYGARERWAMNKGGETRRDLLY